MTLGIANDLAVFQDIVSKGDINQIKTAYQNLLQSPPPSHCPFTLNIFSYSVNTDNGKIGRTHPPSIHPVGTTMSVTPSTKIQWNSLRWHCPTSCLNSNRRLPAVTHENGQSLRSPQSLKSVNGHHDT